MVINIKLLFNLAYYFKFEILSISKYRVQKYFEVVLVLVQYYSSSK